MPTSITAIPVATNPRISAQLTTAHSSDRRARLPPWFLRQPRLLCRKPCQVPHTSSFRAEGTTPRISCLEDRWGNLRENLAVNEFDSFGIVGLSCTEERCLCFMANQDRAIEPHMNSMRQRQHGTGNAPQHTITSQKMAPAVIYCEAINLAEWTGLEPATPGVTGRYSNQLNYHSSQDCLQS